MMIIDGIKEEAFKKQRIKDLQTDLKKFNDIEKKYAAQTKAGVIHGRSERLDRVKNLNHIENTKQWIEDLK